ncbi:DNA repair protein XRCC4 [Drosophila tropicalis]|uniref:DNA repair protein XRCC4 n=1 Tax=Drosophila tropicalis TaxID=46794 RepID=UPI0035ABC748
MSFIVKLLERTQLTHSQVEDVKPFIYAHSKWLDDELELDIVLTSSNLPYRGSLKFSDIRTAADELDQPYEQFFEECKKALTTNMGLTGFDYEVSSSDSQTTSTTPEAVFKLFKCSGYETLYLDIPLRKVSNCFSLLDAAIEQTSDSSSSSVLGKDSQILVEYEKFIEETKSREAKMLKKFLLLINEKKAKIEELELKLEKTRGRRPTAEKEDSDTDEELEQVERDDREEEDIYSGPTQAMNV